MFEFLGRLSSSDIDHDLLVEDALILCHRESRLLEEGMLSSSGFLRTAKLRPFPDTVTSSPPDSWSDGSSPDSSQKGLPEGRPTARAWPAAFPEVMYSLPDITNGRVLPAPAGLIAGALVIVGVLLGMFVNKGLLVVAGLGAFGPGILRKLGWLTDPDEFQRQAARRAGYHAWLVGGLAAVLILSVLQRGKQGAEISIEWIGLILGLMWLTWLFSALLT